MHQVLAAAALLVLLVPGRAVTESRGPQWQPPVERLSVLSAFDPPPRRWLAGHRGIDLRARPGMPVRAVGAGRVAFAGRIAGRGVVVVDHGGLRTTYEPVAADVATGERVATGAPIGTITPGTGHCGDGHCLHLGLRRAREYLDPMLLFGRPETRLRPW